MPAFLAPHKSGAHRVTGAYIRYKLCILPDILQAIALYRALLGKCRIAPSRIDPVALSNVVRNKFKQNRHVTSKYILRDAFAGGYEVARRLTSSTHPGLTKCAQTGSRPPRRRHCRQCHQDNSLEVIAIQNPCKVQSGSHNNTPYKSPPRASGAASSAQRGSARRSSSSCLLSTFQTPCPCSHIRQQDTRPSPHKAATCFLVPLHQIAHRGPPETPGSQSLPRRSAAARQVGGRLG